MSAAMLPRTAGSKQARTPSEARGRSRHEVSWPPPDRRGGQEDRMSVYEKLKSLGITLPELARPGAVYVPFVRTGNLVYVSGHIARKEGKPWVGQLGAGLTTDEGKAAARTIAAELMGTLHAAVGDLDR